MGENQAQAPSTRMAIHFAGDYAGGQILNKVKIEFALLFRAERIAAPAYCCDAP
jgi:hypothetical protein